jgi:hypothetical protein
MANEKYRLMDIINSCFAYIISPIRMKVPVKEKLCTL